MGDFELPKAEMLWPVGFLLAAEGRRFHGWLSHLPTLAKAVGAVQLCFSSQWITSTLYSPGRFDGLLKRFFVAERSSFCCDLTQSILKKTEIQSDIPVQRRMVCIFVCYFGYVFVRFPHFLPNSVRKYRIWTFIALVPKLGRHTAA